MLKYSRKREKSMETIKDKKEINQKRIDDWTALKKQCKNVKVYYMGFVDKYERYIREWYDIPSYMKKSVVLYDEEYKTFMSLMSLYDSLFDLSKIKHSVEVVHDKSLSTDRLKKFESKMSELYAKIEQYAKEFKIHAGKYDRTEDVVDLIHVVCKYLTGAISFDHVVDSRQSYADQNIKTL